MLTTPITMATYVRLILFLLVIYSLSYNSYAENSDDVDTNKTYTLAFFPAEVFYDYAITPALYFSSHKAGTCAVSYMDGTRKTSTVSLIPEQVVEESLPQVNISRTIGVHHRAVYVNCSVKVTLYGYTRKLYNGGSESTSEPFQVLPDSELTNEYLIPSVDKDAFVGIVATRSNTHVSIDLRSTICSDTYRNRDFTNGDTIDVKLDYGEVFQFGNEEFMANAKCGLGGTRIHSNYKISVFSGAYYYPYVGPLIIQVPPTSLMTTSAIVPGSEHNMNIRIISNSNGTTVNITSYETGQGSSLKQRTLKFKWDFLDFVFPPNTSVVLQSNSPIMVTQMYHYNNIDNDGGSLMFVPGVDLYDNNLLVKNIDTNDKGQSFVSVVTETKHIRDLRVNGISISSITWTNLTSVPYSVGRFQIHDKQTYTIKCSSPLFARFDHYIDATKSTTRIYKQSFSYIAAFKTKLNSVDVTSVDQSAFELSCLESGWQLMVDLNKLSIKSSDASHLYLTTDNCVGTLHGHKLLFNYSYHDCNTHSNKINGTLVYGNALVYTSPSSSNLVRDVFWHHDVECHLPVHGSGSVHIYPSYNGHGSGKTTGTVSQSSVHVSLFKDGDFRNEVKGSSIKAEVGGHVYVQVSTRNQNTVMVVHACDAHLENGHNVSFPLIENGCAVDTRTRVLFSRNQVTRFMFDMFDVPNERDGIYVTCHVTFCDPMDFSEECQQGCKTSPHGAIIG